MENQEGSKKKFYKKWWFWVLVVIVLFIIIGASGSSKPGVSVPAPSDTENTAPAQAQSQAQAPAAPQTLLDLTGSGSKTTAKFTAASDWDLNWTYDCSNFAIGQGNFIVTVYNGDGSMSFSNAGVNQEGVSGSDVDHYHKGGTYYLEVNSECKWMINVKG